MALGIFIATYALLAGVTLPGLSLGRPAAAMVGAAAMVAATVLSPTQAIGAIDVDTLVLLTGMMVLAAALTEAGFFDAVAFSTLRLAKTPVQLLTGLMAVAAASSALLVNDTVCLMLTPLVLAMTKQAKLAPTPYLLGLCMASNTGSLATFTGNPQNMLIGLASGGSFARFAAFMVLPATVATAATWLVLRRWFREPLAAREVAPTTAPGPVNRPLLSLTLGTVVVVAGAFLAGRSMPWTAFIGGAAVLVLSGRHASRLLPRVDGQLLLFFACLFVVVQGVNQAGWALRMREVFSPLMAGGPLRETLGFTALSLVASNVFSNVPFVMLARAWVPTMAEPELAWQVLALASTLAGNLTLIGSVANLIVFEGAKDVVTVSFWQYLRVGVPATLLSLAAALTVLLVEHRLVGA